MPNTQLLQQIFILRNQHQYKYLVQIVPIFLRSIFCSVPLCLPYPAPQLRTCWAEALTTELHAPGRDSRPQPINLSHLCSFLQTTGDRPLALPRPRHLQRILVSSCRLFSLFSLECFYTIRKNFTSGVQANTSLMMLTLTIS